MTSNATNCTKEDHKNCATAISTTEHIECMYDNIFKLTKSCRKLISMEKTCLSDIEKYCPNEESEFALLACLTENKKHLSNICRVVIK